MIHDRDSKLALTFDEVFRSDGIRVVPTPVRTPHLESVMRSYIQHYNTECPHRGLALRPPEAPQLNSPTASAAIQRRDELGGLCMSTEPQPDE